MRFVKSEACRHHRIGDKGPEGGTEGSGHCECMHRSKMVGVSLVLLYILLGEARWVQEQSFGRERVLDPLMV